MPVTVAVTYRTYEAQRSRGTLDLRGTRCSDADCRAATGGAALVLSRTAVLRWIILLQCDAPGFWICLRLRVWIAVAYCQRCRGRFRVLPCDVLPYKQYTLSAIEYAIDLYHGGKLSLRQSVAQILGERTPVHATLHGWTEGLGAFELGLDTGELPGCTPASRLLAETEAHVPAVVDERELVPPIPPVRYRSPERRERLEASFAFVGCAILVAAQLQPYRAMTEWNRLLLDWVQGSSWPLGFRSALTCTRFEHGAGGGLPTSGRDEPEEHKRWPDRARSPPGASSR